MRYIPKTRTTIIRGICRVAKCQNKLLNRKVKQAYVAKVSVLLAASYC